MDAAQNYFRSRVLSRISSTWGEDRLQILRHIILTKGYGHYAELTRRLVVIVDEVLAEDHVATERARRPSAHPADSDDSSDESEEPSTQPFELANERIKKVFMDTSDPRPWWKQDFPTFEPSPEINVSAFLAGKATNQWLVDFAMKQQSWMTPYQKLLMTTCVSAYFQKTPAMYPVHRNMNFAFRSERTGLSPTKSVQQFISGAGPFLIKTLQQVSNGLKADDPMKELTESVFNSIMPMTGPEFDLLLERNTASQPYRNIDKKSIGAASIGETHVCRDPKTNAKIAVVKFIKPVSVWLFLCEVDFLLGTVWPMFNSKPRDDRQTIMNNKKCRQMLLFLIREFAREFDVAREAVGTEEAREIYYRPKVGILTPALCEYRTEPVPLLVLQYIEGQSLETFMTELEKLDPVTAHRCLVPVQRRVALLMGLWLEELFWGSGRFDADPHKGNVLVPTFAALQSGAPPWIALIDFGSYGKLERRAQCVVFKTLIAGERIKQFKLCVPKPPTPGEPMPLADQQNFLDTVPLLKFFRNFGTLSAVDQTTLILNLRAQVAREPKTHARNLELVRTVIKSIWQICDVAEDPAETERLIPLCIDYAEEVDFGSIFLNLAQFGETIGTCSSSSVLMYGRGLAYLDQMWRLTSRLCEQYEDLSELNGQNKKDLELYLATDVPKCDRSKLINLIWTFFFKHGRLSFDFVTGCPAYQSKPTSISSKSAKSDTKSAPKSSPAKPVKPPPSAKPRPREMSKA